MLSVKEFVKVKTVDEAYELLQKGRQNRIIGGMLWLRQQDISISTAIDLSGCGLNLIEEKEDEVWLGAMVSLRDLETSEVVQSLYDGIISDSVRDIVGVQFRNLATIGGSIYSRFGFSDVLTALLCLETDVILHHGGRIPLKEYVNMPYERDVLTHIVIKKEAGNACYLSERRSATDFPVLAVAISYILCDQADENTDNAGNLAGKWHIAVGARPMRAQVISADLPLNVSESDVAALTERILSEMNFGSNMRGSKEYRELLAKTLVERAMKEVKEGSRC